MFFIYLFIYFCLKCVCFQYGVLYHLASEWIKFRSLKRHSRKSFKLKIYMRKKKSILFSSFFYITNLAMLNILILCSHSQNASMDTQQNVCLSSFLRLFFQSQGQLIILHFSQSKGFVIKVDRWTTKRNNINHIQNEDRSE